VKVDLEDLDQRTLALPLPAKNYVGLTVGKAGVIFVLEAPSVFSLDDPPPENGPPLTVHRFDLAKRKGEKLTEGVNRVSVSDSGEKMPYSRGEGWFLAGPAGPAKPGDGELKLGGLEVRVEPQAEWRQIYNEVYRIERDFLYDPNFHGYDLKGAWASH